MAIKNKKRYVVYLDEANTEYVKDFLQTSKNKGGFSGLVDGYVKTMSRTLKLANYKKGQDRVTAKQMLKIGWEGIKQDVL